MPDVGWNVLDRLAMAISPKWGVGRLQSRIQAAHAANVLPRIGHTWKGARSDAPSLKKFNARGGSPRSDLEPEQGTLRARSRALVKNSPLASSASNTACTHVVGTGLRLQSQIDADVVGLTPEQAAEKQGEFERFWRYQQKRLDFESSEPFSVLQAIAFRGTFESGDILAVRRRDPRPGDLIGLKVQLIEADRVSTPRDKLHDDHVQMGVRTDPRTGRPVSYFVSDRHPGDTRVRRHIDDWAEVPADSASGMPLARLLLEKRRAGQLRGIPSLAPVIKPLRDIAALTDSELDASIVQSIFTVFVKTEVATDPSGLPLAPEGTSEQDTPDEGEGEIMLGTGTIADLAPGESIDLAKPERPNDMFEPFFHAIVEQIGASIEIPFEVLLHRYQSSYSAARAALLDAWKFFRSRRMWLAAGFCQMVYEWALTEAAATGVLEIPGFFDDPILRDAWLNSEWIGDSPGQINPKDESEAAEKRIEIGISNRTIETAQIMGRDWEDVHRRSVEEKDMRVQDGMQPDTAALAEQPSGDQGAPGDPGDSGDSGDSGEAAA